MNKVKHIIWDWNGTLVDDGWLFTELINQVLKKRDLKEISLEDYRQTFCFPLEKYYERLGFNFNVEPYDIPSMEFVHLYNKNKYRPYLYKKAASLLEKMKERSIKNYLLSAQNHSSLLDLTDFYNVSGLFEIISGTDNLHARGKSSLANKLITNLGVRAHEVLFVGDTNLDIKIATATQSFVVAAAYGHQSKNRFPNQKNILIVNSFNELFDLLNLKFRDYR